ncbi:porin family protein [Pseudoalteromonas sp. SMS1]|uniref:porin family protein n=1 Tax=Pseudoalteromonas sp. SMS1 TaxID=2908894 RepID=UPI001F22EF41|nr:porin family protein [Pseudoalteromonas sp. SMS1]MCF2858361.1 porin family protein [Pseudoalteromonas sp. SMS1]
MKQTLLALSVALLSSNAIANDAISFDYVGAGYAEFKASNSNIENSFDGFAIEASKKLNEKWVVSGLYADTSYDKNDSRTIQYNNAVQKITGHKDYDVAQWELGISHLVSVEENSVVEFKGFFGRFDLESTHKGASHFQNKNTPNSVYDVTVYDTNATAHNRTYGLQAKYHYAFSDSVSGIAGVGYQHINDANSENNFSYQLGLQYKIIDGFTISALFSDADVFETRQITLRYNF